MDGLVSSALMIRLSLQPSPASDASAFNNIRALRSRWAGLFPFRISASSRSRSSPLSRTIYFFTEISFAAMIASVARVATKANHQILSIWLKRPTSPPFHQQPTQEQSSQEVRLRDRFLLPQRWWHDAPLSRVALHQMVALGVPSVEVSHDQCQRSHAATRLRSASRCSALARKSRLATKSSRELLAGDQVSPGRFDPKNATLPSQPP